MTRFCSPFSPRLARLELGNRFRRPVSSKLPPRRLSTSRSSMLRSPVAACKRLRPSPEPGLLLACPDWFLRPPRQGHRSWPRSSANRQTSFAARSAFAPRPAAPTLFACLRPDRIIASGPVATTSISRLPAPHPLQLPVLGYCPPDGLTLPEAPHGQGLPRGSARSPFAPRQASLSICPPDRRSGSATVPEANCSSDLLEPSPLYAEAQFVSKVFYGFESFY